MKKPKVHILVAVMLLFMAFTLGLYIGRNHNVPPVTVSVSPAMQTLPPETTASTEPPTEPEKTVTFPIDINRADETEFMALPGIGEVLARRILDYREENGLFSRVEELMTML